MPAKPRVFTEQELAQIQTMAGYGLPVEQIAAVVDCSKATFDRAIKRSPRGVESLLKGRAIANAKVLESLFKQAISQKCVAATIFWAKVKLGWKAPTEDDQEERGFEFTGG
jgi:IS30 family transposase